MSASWPHACLSFIWSKNLLQPPTFASCLCSQHLEMLRSRWRCGSWYFSSGGYVSLLEQSVSSKLSITANGFMNFLRIKGFLGDRWRLIPCKEGEEKSRYLSWWEKGKKRFVQHSCKWGILDSWRHFYISVWMVTNLDKKLVPVKRWMNCSSFLTPSCMAASGEMQAELPACCERETGLNKSLTTH